MSYLDRLHAEFDEITRGIATVTDAATEANRDLTDAEAQQIERDDKRANELQAAINHYTKIAQRNQAVAALRSQIPAGTDPVGGQRVVEQEPEYDLLREFPTPGHWASMLYRAWSRREPAAIALLERATAHQMTTDNPGVVPQLVVDPVVNRMKLMRPLIQSVTTRTPPGPKFDRPLVTQQVDVGLQVIEKDLTTSRKMITQNVTITLNTHAGHLNISKQDIRWSQPSILNLVYESFAKMYARVSDSAACSVFATKVTQTQEVPDTAPAYTAGGLDTALGAAGVTIAGASGDNGELNHAWMARDVAVILAKLRNVNTGAKLYNIPLINGTTGDLDGIPVTIDPRFVSGTFIVGDDSLVEFWEDLEGFLSVDEPEVLGQLVGYAGYNQLGVIDPTGFVKITNATLLAEKALGGPSRGK